MGSRPSASRVSPRRIRRTTSLLRTLDQPLIHADGTRRSGRASLSLRYGCVIQQKPGFFMSNINFKSPKSVCQQIVHQTRDHQWTTRSVIRSFINTKCLIVGTFRIETNRCDGNLTQHHYSVCGADLVERFRSVPVATQLWLEAPASNFRSAKFGRLS